MNLSASMVSLVSEKKLQMAQSGDLDPLIKLLRHDNEQTRTLTAKVVNELTYSEEDDITLRGPEGYKALIDLMQTEDDEVRSKAVWSMAILALTDENQGEVIKHVGWDIILDLMKDDVVEVQCGGVTLLGNLALLDENKNSIIDKGGVDVLMSLLKGTRDIIVKRAIVTALSNIVDSDNAREVIDDEGLDALLQLLEKSDDERLLTGAVHTVSNIANAENNKFNKQISKQALDRLVQLLGNGSDAIQKGAVMVLNGLSTTVQFQSDLIKHGAVDAMKEILTKSEDSEMILGIVLCINNLAQNGENQEDLAEVGIAEVLEQIANSTDDHYIKNECAEAIRASGEFSPKMKRSSGSPRSPSKSPSSSSSGRVPRKNRPKTDIKDNVRRVIKVLIKDPKNQDKLQECGVIPTLVSLIAPEQQDAVLKGLALDALTMMAMNNSSNQQDIALADLNKGLFYIEKMIKSTLTKPAILLRAVRLLGALCWKNKIIQDLASEKQMLQTLISFLETFDNSLKKCTMTTIACIVDANQKNQHIVNKMNGDKMISQILMKEVLPDSLVAAAAQAITSQCRENPKSQEVCSRAVGSVLMHLETSARNGREEEDQFIQEHLTGAMLELARNHSANKSILWQMHVMSPMLRILQNAKASPVTHYNILGLIWEYCKSESKLKKMSTNEHVIRILRPLTESRDAVVRDAALRVKARFSG